MADTDFWQADQTTIPGKHHRAVRKETGLTIILVQFGTSFMQCRSGRDLSFTATSVSLPKELNVTDCKRLHLILSVVIRK